MLRPLDKTSNETGWFPCAMKSGELESSEFEMPKYWDCDSCVLRLSWGEQDIENFKEMNVRCSNAVKRPQEKRFIQPEKAETVPEEIPIAYMEEEDLGESELSKNFDYIYIGIASTALTISILAYSFTPKRKKAAIKDPQADDKYLLIKEENVGDVKVEKEDNIVDKSKRKEIVEDDKFAQDGPLAEYKRPSRKQRKAAAAKEKNKKIDKAPVEKLPEDLLPRKEKPIEKEAKNSAKEVQKQEAKEVVQKAPEAIQERKPQPAAKIVPEAPIEEEKGSGTSTSTPVKEGSPGSKENQLESPERKGEPKGVKKVIDSNQREVLKEFKMIKEMGRTVWRGTHFIFMLDCSITMEGARWDSTVNGYIECVKRLNGMEDIIISGFSFDTIRSPFCREKIPAKATIDKSLIPCTKKKRKYERALKYITQIIERSQYRDHLACMIFISNGSGGYNESYSTDLLKQIEEGRKFVSYIIGAACNVDDEGDLIQLTRDLKGEYYKVDEPEVISDALLSILGL